MKGMKTSINITKFDVVEYRRSLLRNWRRRSKGLSTGSTVYVQAEVKRRFLEKVSKPKYNNRYLLEARQRRTLVSKIYMRRRPPKKISIISKNRNSKIRVP